MKLRKACLTDTQALVELFLEACLAWGHVTTPDNARPHIESWLVSSLCEVWLLMDGETAVGFIDMWVAPAPVMPYQRTFCQFLYVREGYSALPLMRQFKHFNDVRKIDVYELSCQRGSQAEQYWRRHKVVEQTIIFRGVRYHG